MRQRCRGFTLLELMIVIVLIGVLLGMATLLTPWRDLLLRLEKRWSL